MVELKYDPKIEILKVKFSGSIELEDIKDYVKRIVDLDDLPTNLDILNDMIDVDQYVSVDEVNKILRAVQPHLANYNRVRVASVHEKPQSTAISTLIRERNRFENMEYRVYSAQEAALEWLMIK
ncbi:MAG: STAS/SEC14 domain-containing protein [Bacteroidota bacterium]|nr:STAS/SEC14 domain-containing protein [Bacteroidota bacterium]